MKYTPLLPDRSDGKESIMDLSSVDVKEIRFNIETREIRIGYEEPLDPAEELNKLNWREIKSQVIEVGGQWSDKAEGIEFLLGVKK